MLLTQYEIESCAGRVHARGLPVPALAEWVRKLVELYVRGGLNLVRVGAG